MPHYPQAASFDNARRRLLGLRVSIHGSKKNAASRSRWEARRGEITPHNLGLRQRLPQCRQPSFCDLSGLEMKLIQPRQPLQVCQRSIRDMNATERKPLEPR